MSRDAQYTRRLYIQDMYVTQPSNFVLEGSLNKETFRGLRKDRVRDMIKDLTRISSRCWLFLIQVGRSGSMQMQAASRPTYFVYIEK